MAKGKKVKISFVWGIPNDRIKRFCATSPCIVMLTSGEKKVYVPGTGHYFYKHEFTYEEKPQGIMPPQELLDIVELNSQEKVEP